MTSDFMSKVHATLVDFGAPGLQALESEAKSGRHNGEIVGEFVASLACMEGSGMSDICPADRLRICHEFLSSDDLTIRDAAACSMEHFDKPESALYMTAAIEREQVDWLREYMTEVRDRLGKP